MLNLRLLLLSAATGALLCGIAGAVAARGTSVLLPGLGLVVAGPLVAGLFGLIVGSLLELFAAALVILARSNKYL